MSFDAKNLDLQGKHSLVRLQKLVRLLKPEYCSIYVRVCETCKAILADPANRQEVQRQVNELILEKTLTIL